MIIEHLSNLQFNAASSLSPSERLQAARWFDRNFLGHDTFILICGLTLIVLTMLFIIVTLSDSIKKRRSSNRLFVEYADKRGLNIRERHILMNIALRARLRLVESIFTMSDVFSRGATQMIRSSLLKDGTKRSRYLSEELSILREKLGFRGDKTALNLALKEGKPDSRQIVRGRKLYITSLDTHEFFEVEALVVENNELELSIQPVQPVQCEPGDNLCVRYYFGAPIWEFDTCVLRKADNVIALQHSNKIRYVNRRRFLRVAVDEPAYIAAFPFAREVPGSENSKHDDVNDSSERLWGPPEFVRADVTELAGPGLRLIAPLEVNVGDRVAVILKLSREKSQNYNPSDFSRSNQQKPSKIIEDIGIVRHTQPLEEGFSIAIELTALNESNISEMVRATNKASLNRSRIKDIPLRSKEKQNKWEYISETTIG